MSERALAEEARSLEDSSYSGDADAKRKLSFLIRFISESGKWVSAEYAGTVSAMDEGKLRSELKALLRGAREESGSYASESASKARFVTAAMSERGIPVRVSQE